jgi:hypothetical protein
MRLRDRKRRGWVNRLIALDLLVCLSAYVGAAWWRGGPIFDYLQNPERRTQTAGLFRSDRLLGYVAVPGATGAYHFPGGLTVPIGFDASGFRVSGSTSTSAPTILTLGDSYAFGDAVSGQETFTAITAGQLGVGAANAALSGYGLAQMVLLAERLVPQLRPAVVLVQYAPWLVERAVSDRAPSAVGAIPTPYFTAQGDRIVAPHFETKVFGSRFWAFANREQPRPKWQFVLQAALPYYVATDFSHVDLALRRAFGDIPPPATDRLAVVRAAYSRIQRVATAHRAKVLVFAVAGQPMAPAAEVVTAIKGTGAVFVDLEAALAGHLGERPTPELHRQRYAVWAGQPERMVDPHPNALANTLMAEALAAAIIDRGLLIAP